MKEGTNKYSKYIDKCNYKLQKTFRTIEWNYPKVLTTGHSFTQMPFIKRHGTANDKAAFNCWELNKMWAECTACTIKTKKQAA